MNHATWKTRQAKELCGQGPDLGPRAQQIYDETELAMEIGRAVYQRRTEMSWSQAELARHRAAGNQPDVALHPHPAAGGDRAGTVPPHHHR